MHQQEPYSAVRARLAALGVAVAAVLASGGAALGAGETANLSLELNKLEPGEHGCRAFLVIDNRADTAFSAFKLDLVLFRPDGVIGKRLMLDLAPIKPRKRAVKIFSIDDTACDAFANILINDVAECRSDAAPIEDCLTRLDLKSLSPVQLTK